MFGTLFRVQLRALAILAAVTFVVLTVAGINQTLHQNELNQLVDASERQARFWALVAGEETSIEPTVENLLARDLQPLVDDPDLVDKFRAPTNRYGGIADAIGVDPFNGRGLNCTECGPLSAESEEKIRQIADGNFEYVRNTTLVEYPDDGYQLTPWGLSVPVTIFLWFTVAGPLSMVVVHGYLRMLDDEYKVRSLGDLDWEYGSVQRNAVIVLGWPVTLPYMLYRKLNSRRFEAKVRATFPEQMALLDQTDRMLGRVSGPQLGELQRVRDEVRHELEVQTRSGMNASDLELQFLTEQLRNANEFLHLRSGVLAEKGEDHGSPQDTTSPQQDQG